MTRALGGLALTLLACHPTVSSTRPSFTAQVTVSAVRDGDTITVVSSGAELDVRLIWVNAPEDGECAADRARAHLEAALDGRRVGLETHGVDQFGRTLAVVWADDRSVNLGLVEAGMALATADSGEYLLAERSAAERGLGLWGADACGGGPLPNVTIDPAHSTFDAPGPDGSNLGGEVVTIVNAGAVEIDLDGWGLRDESSRHRFTFPHHTRLGPGETMTIASDDPGWEPGGSPVWNNDGDIVMILDTRGRVVDHWRYGPSP